MTDRLREEVNRITSELEDISRSRRELSVQEDRLLRQRQALHNQIRDETATERLPRPDRAPYGGRRA